ncbi:hypothetical protein QCI77_16015 [Bacillus cereus group sp. MG9]|uniref:hypothetical protein n=1 Tax=Bacillus cereus group sp. MG9 TaxID=3040247 RepID=UPI00339B6EAF
MDGYITRFTSPYLKEWVCGLVDLSRYLRAVPPQNSAKAKKFEGGLPVKVPLSKVSLYFRRVFSVAPFVYFSLI